MKSVFINNALLVAIFVSTNAPALSHGDEPAKSSIHEGTVHGSVSDSMCKSDHAAMIKAGHGKDAPSCAAKCIAQGQKYVLIDKKNKVVYTLSNPKMVSKFVGKAVVVSGHIDDKTKVIHLHNVKPE